MRKKRGLSQEELANIVGVDSTAVSHWENGFARPGIARLLTVASALGISVEELIDGEEAA